MFERWEAAPARAAGGTGKPPPAATPPARDAADGHVPQHVIAALLLDRFRRCKVHTTMFRCLVVGALGGWVFAFRGGLKVLHKVRSVSRFVPGLLQEIAPRILHVLAFVVDWSLHEAKDLRNRNVRTLIE